MLKRVLIANRGEIAVRIARTCRRLGVEYVAVYSDADRHAPHLSGATASVPIGGSIASASYLDAGKVVAAAVETGCDAVHPGYGFLSENPGFARAVQAAGLAFIGPDAGTIEALGDKARAKALMRQAGVPTVPGGAEATEDLARIERLAAEVGFPVLLKPSAGGGGKGMHIVRAEAALHEAARQGMRVARANFGDGRLLVERFIDNPRHVEVQVFGDRHGNVVHLFERECSLQRRHQKVIEEAPAASLRTETRAALLEAAVRGARAIGYVNAGTFEFIVGPAGDFHFLEVNTRLQVEHPVSEEITGIDFVEWQLRIAAGEPLPLAQDAIVASGHAIECRIYAEDAANGFQPAPGKVAELRWPAGARVESGIAAGGEIPSFYDPMVAKLVVHAPTRPAALDKALAALERTVILGLTTNLGFLRRVLSDPAVRANEIDTRYLDRHVERHGARASVVLAPACAAVMDLGRVRPEAAPAWPWLASASGGVFDRVHLDAAAPWGAPRYWDDAAVVQAAILGPRDGAMQMRCAGRDVLVDGSPEATGLWSGRVAGEPWYGAQAGDRLELQVAGDRVTLRRYDMRSPAQAAGGGTATATMPGVVVAVPVAVGDRVSTGATLAIVEAMKMENRVLAAFEGRVIAIHCGVGDNVRAGDVLVSVDAD